MASNLLMIQTYYALIDQKNIPAVLKLFAEEASYVRADRSLQGKNEIQKFYESERRLDGTHTIKHHYQLADTVIVQGYFEGINGQGENISLGFSDFFQIKNSQIIHRHTYLAQGAEVVQ